jgi:hypothetical protein
MWLQQPTRQALPGEPARAQPSSCAVYRRHPDPYGLHSGAGPCCCRGIHRRLADRVRYHDGCFRFRCLGRSSRKLEEIAGRGHQEGAGRRVRRKVVVMDLARFPDCNTDRNTPISSPLLGIAGGEWYCGWEARVLWIVFQTNVLISGLGTTFNTSDRQSQHYTSTPLTRPNPASPIPLNHPRNPSAAPSAAKLSNHAARPCQNVSKFSKPSQQQPRKRKLT